MVDNTTQTLKKENSGKRSGQDFKSLLMIKKAKDALHNSKIHREGTDCTFIV
jgi:hypothetical protein